MRALPLICFLTITVSSSYPALAQAYKCKTEGGTVLYSDRPCNGESHPITLHDSHLGLPPPIEKNTVRSPSANANSNESDLNKLHKNMCNQVVAMYEGAEKKIKSDSFSEYTDGVKTKKRLMSAYIQCAAEAQSGN